MKRFFKYHFFLLFSVISIFISSSIPGDNLPDFSVNFSDKLIHIAIYCVLSLAFIYSLKNQKLNAKLSANAVLFALIFSAFYGATDEFHQYFVVNRTCEFYDFLADMIGTSIGCTIFFALNRFKLNKGFIHFL